MYFRALGKILLLLRKTLLSQEVNEDQIRMMDEAINNAAPNGHEDWDKAAHELEGFYWWPCSPGCLPNGDPVGPFKTESEALENAREGIE